MSSEKLFDPVDHDSVADSVVAQIELMLVAGILKEGTKLPSERHLAESMNVSRPKLREALKRLEEAQLLETRHGEGHFVAALTGQAMSPALIALYARHPVAFFDYLEYRRNQEAFAARLAAERATDPDREIIRACMDRLQQTWISADDQGSREADAAFHSAVVDASHNRTLIHMMGSIFQLTRQGVFYNRHFLHTIDGSGQILIAQHLAIGEAILVGDADAAAAAAIAHIDFVEDSFRKGLQTYEREAVARKRTLLRRETT